MNKVQILLTLVIVAALAAGFIQRNPEEALEIEQSSNEQLKKDYSKVPGQVANVFGWGYNRSSCFLDDLDDTIVFFYAEDQNIYYTFILIQMSTLLLKNFLRHRTQTSIYYVMDQTYTSQ